jgi:hypothetical protein
MQAIFTTARPSTKIDLSTKQMLEEWLVGHHLLLGDLGPDGIILMNACVVTIAICS